MVRAWAGHEPDDVWDAMDGWSVWLKVASAVIAIAAVLVVVIFTGGQ